MKRKLVTFGTAALFLIGASFITSCGNTQNEENQEEHQNMEADESGQMNDEKTDENSETEQTAAVYECPMHPEVTGKEGENCSKCGMPLEEAKAEEDHSGHDHE